MSHKESFITSEAATAWPHYALRWNPKEKVCWAWQEVTLKNTHQLHAFIAQIISAWISSLNAGEGQHARPCVLGWCARHNQISQQKGQKDHPSPLILIKNVKMTPTYNCILWKRKQSQLSTQPSCVPEQQLVGVGGTVISPLQHGLKLSKQQPSWAVFWCNLTGKHQKLDPNTIKSHFGRAVLRFSLLYTH